MVASTVVFMLAEDFWGFLLAIVLFTTSFAFWSGTADAFMHNTFLALKRKDFTKNMSKINAKISLISVAITLGLPFLTKISFLAIFQTYLVIDLIGLIITTTLVNPPEKHEVMENKKSVWNIAKSGWGTGFYPVAIFFGLIAGFTMGSASFREVYAQALGFPLVWIGSIFAVSRIIWFFIGHNAHHIEKIGLKKIMTIEMIAFPASFIIGGLLNSPYVIGGLFAITIGYFFSRSYIIKNYILENFIEHKAYKATMISIKEQVRATISIVVTFSIGFVMNVSYSLGFILLGVSLFILLAIVRPFVPAHKPSNNS